MKNKQLYMDAVDVFIYFIDRATSVLFAAGVAYTILYLLMSWAGIIS